jgi:hypothetical protein
MTNDFDPSAMFAAMMKDRMESAAAPSAPEPELAAQLLRDAYAVLNKSYDFKRGEIIRQKQGLESSRKGERGGVGIFIGYVNWNDDGVACFGGMPLNEAELVPAGTTLEASIDDMVIGHLTPDNAMMLHRTDSRFYEPVEPRDDSYEITEVAF